MVLRIATFNVNGLRAATRRGFRGWLDEAAPDIVALQEVRCPVDLLPDEAHAGYHLTYEAGTLAGRNGVALMTSVPPTATRVGFAPREFAHEGRYVEADLDYPGFALTVASLYLPKGGLPFGPDADPKKFARKLRFMASLRAYLTRARRDASRHGRQFLIMGDFNIAHTGLDVNAPSRKTRSEGFLPQERAWFESIVGPRTLVDVVRRLHPNEQGPYSWWSWMGQSWNSNAGWRIDYHLASRGLADRAVAGGTHRAPTYEARISDHAPVVVDYV